MVELTRSELESALRDRLRANPQPGADTATGDAWVHAAVAALTTLDDPDAQAAKRIDSSLLDRDRCFAIPDDALNLFPAAVQAVVAAFAKGPIAALPDLAATWLRYRALRVPITAEEAAVLRVLKRAKLEGKVGLAPADIVERIGSEGVPIAGDAVLMLLEALAVKKTEKATLVREAAGRWAIGNV